MRTFADIKLQQALNHYALVYGVTPSEIMDRDKNSVLAVGEARRAVWGELRRRQVPVSKIAEMFGRTPAMIRMGVKMVQYGHTKWPRQRTIGEPTRWPGEPEDAYLRRRLPWLKATFAKLKTRFDVAQREAIAAECALISARLRELKETP